MTADDILERFDAAIATFDALGDGDPAVGVDHAYELVGLDFMATAEAVDKMLLDTDPQVAVTLALYVGFLEGRGRAEGAPDASG